MNILALDLAKITGHADFTSGLISSGTKSFAPLRGQGTEALFGKWMAWLDNEITTKEIDNVAYELIDWDIVGVDWRNMYKGMTAIIRGNCFNHRIDSRGYPVRDVKMAATGHKTAKKGEMIRTARLMWPEQRIVDDNQADALWVLYVAMKSLDIEVRAHPEMLFN